MLPDYKSRQIRVNTACTLSLNPYNLEKLFWIDGDMSITDVYWPGVAVVGPN